MYTFRKLIERKMNMASGLSCDTCAYFTYDDEDECYVCDIDIDEDDYSRLVEGHFRDCPYYTNGDEYRVVKHQM